MDYLVAEIAVCLLLAFLLGCLIGWFLKRVGSKRQQRALQAEIEGLQQKLQQDLQPAGSVAPVTAQSPAATAIASSDPVVEQPLATAAVATASLPSGAEAANAARDSAIGAASAAASTDPADLESSYEIEEIEGIGAGYGRRLRGMGIETTLDLLNRCEDQAQIGTVAEQVGIEQFVVQTWLCMADLLRVPGIRGPYADLLSYAGVQSVGDLAGRNPSTLGKELARLHEQEQRGEELPSTEVLTAWIAAAAQ